ncbi:fibrocystin-L-like [Amphiura filiformis]|uniref:fibrocystin-L-like n=1 Tax=Amphiura filiformis TaxID=82378 RepID=UPI003B213D2F
MIVKPKGTFIESQQFSFLISGEYGRCYNEPHSLLVSGQNKIYNYQTHAEITNVLPSSGSVEGGTAITINGNYFYDRAQTTVTVGGVPCVIYKITDTAIACITQKAPVTKDTYPGSRGILWEKWTNTNSFDDTDWNTDADDYISEVQLDGSSPKNTGDYFVGRLRGYFVPPRDGEYRFLIRSNDNSQLFFSYSGDTTNMAVIAQCPQQCSEWTKYSEQSSAKLSLQGGSPYYIEARYKEGSGGDYLEIGFEMFDAPVTNAQIKSAHNEKQNIAIESTVNLETQVSTNSQIKSAHNEKQYIAIESTVNLETLSLLAVGTNEVQEVKIAYAGCAGETDEEMGACNVTENFWLTYEGRSTDAIPVSASAEEVEDHLSNLTSIPLMVALEENDVIFTYTVVFETYEDLSLLGADSSDPSLVGTDVVEISSGSHASNTNLSLLGVDSSDPSLVEMDVVEISSGSHASDTSFVLYYGSVEALTPLSTTSSAEEVMNGLLQLKAIYPLWKTCP